ncbi:phosphopantetheine-binding protein [Streptomyces sp. NPDC003952]
MLNTIESSTDGMLKELRTGLSYVGTTQFGSCVQQAVCNVLEAQGLKDAADLIGVSWGFTYGPGYDRLRAGERWVPAVARLSGLDLGRQRFESASAAFDAEQAALRAGVPVVVAVDSFDIASPYLGRTHLMHALIVVEWGPDSVTVLDPMNEPGPSSLSLDTYRRTRASAVARDFDMVVSYGTVERPYSAVDALTALHADAVTHREASLADLDEFICAVEAGSVAPDVADVAAERTYAHRLMAAAAKELPTLEPLATKVDALARRWYFAHTVGMDGNGQSPQRMAKILRDLREREVKLLDAMTEAAEAVGPKPTGEEIVVVTPPNLIERITTVLARQTSVTTEDLAATDDLWAAGLTSLESVRLMIGLEDEFGIEFPASLLSRNSFGSVAAMADAVGGLLAETSELAEGQA